MPTYEYRCKDCGTELEVVQAFTDDALTTCEACGGALKKVFGSVGISFKGSGFYKNDSRGSKVSGSSGGDSGSSGDSGSGDKGSGDSGSSSGDGSTATKAEPAAKAPKADAKPDKGSGTSKKPAKATTSS